MSNPALAPEHFDERKDRIAPMVNALAARAVAALSTETTHASVMSQRKA